MSNGFGVAAYRYKDILELQKDHDSVIEKYSKLSKELERLNSELENKCEQEQSARKTLVINQKDIRNFEKDIFFMKKKQYELDETALSLVKEVEKKEAKLSELHRSKSDLGNHIKTIEKEYNEVSIELSDLEEKNNQHSQRYLQLNSEKQSISDNISKCLSDTSFSREKLEAQLWDMNKDFVNGVEDRKNLTKQLSDQTISLDRLISVSNDLKKQIISIEEIKELNSKSKDIQEKLNQNEKDNRMVKETLGKLKNSVHEKTGGMMNLSSENVSLKEKIQAIEEKITAYQKLLTETDQAKDVWNRSNEALNAGYAKLKEILIKKGSLEQDMRIILTQWDDIEKALKSLAM